MKKIITTISATIFIAGVLFSQTSDQVSTDPGHLTCGQNHAMQSHFDANPGLERESKRAQLAAIEGSKQKKSGGDGDADYVIPVVFHIVHTDGSENISDAQVASAMEVLNEDFNANTPNIENVNPAFTDVVGNANVEFRLARKDPDGNCTNGINRVFSEETNGGGEDAKTGDAATWGRSKYLNIWVVNSIGGGVAGYAYLPWGAPPSGDGIIIEDTYVGRIGTGNASRSHALSHEAGHWGGLNHTWGNSAGPGLPGNCSGDDGFDDTPNTLGWSTCDLDGETCGSLDNVENFMDYAYCYKMFTQEQTDLVRFVLESGPSSRPSLSTASNLINTGVFDADVVCHVDFTTSDEPIICPGQELEFTDLSFNGVTTREWTFEGGTPATSSDVSPEVSWDTPGVYDVTLTASNANGGETTTKTGFVHVLEAAQNSLPYSEGFESFTDLEDNDQNWFVLDEGVPDEKWELSETVAYSGSKSVFVPGRTNSENAVEILSSPTYDLSDVSENAVLTFKYAHAKRSSFSDDRLRVFISKNCGDNWSLRKTISIDDLPTVSGNVSGTFVPDGQDEWAEVWIDNISSVFLNDKFRIRFEYTSYRGNHIYIDNINIVDGATVGLEGVTFVNKLDLYPNPSSSRTTLRYGLESSSEVRVDVLDMSGRIVNQVFFGAQAAGDQNIDIELSELVSGVYLVRIQSGGEQIVRKLVKQ